MLLLTIHPAKMLLVPILLYLLLLLCGLNSLGSQQQEILGCCKGEHIPGLEGEQSPQTSTVGGSRAVPGSLALVSVSLGPSALTLLEEMLMDLGCVSNRSVG